MTASIRGGIFTMAMLLKGAEVAKALTEELHAKTEELKKNGVEPCLAILRVGAREDDLAYERGALKRCEKVGVAVRQVVLPEDVTQKVLMENIHAAGGTSARRGPSRPRPARGCSARCRGTLMTRRRARRSTRKRTWTASPTAP